jgi:hypothetical protein
VVVVIVPTFAAALRNRRAGSDWPLFANSTNRAFMLA